MTNPLANELRQILTDLDTETVSYVRERLRLLAERVELLAAETTVEHTLDATISSALEPEQEIRVEALHAAARLTAARDFYEELADARVLDAVAAVTKLADAFAGWIRDGSRP